MRCWKKDWKSRKKSGRRWDKLNFRDRFWSKKMYLVKKVQFWNTLENFGRIFCKKKKPLDVSSIFRPWKSVCLFSWRKLSKRLNFGTFGRILCKIFQNAFTRYQLWISLTRCFRKNVCEILKQILVEIKGCLDVCSYLAGACHNEVCDRKTYSLLQILTKISAVSLL